ncbi:MAG: hypothetical protein NT090_05680 [Acidobacteria bacterium]|nr:hypothetical protein [Acidobacteriota bacterium]
MTASAPTVSGASLRARVWPAARGILSHHQRLHAQVGALGGEFASRETAGVLAFVLHPDAHSATARLVHGEAHQIEPAGRKVRRFHPVARLDHDGGKPARFDLVEIADDDFLGHGAVPAPPQHHAVFGRRRGEIAGDLGHAGIVDPLPGPFGGEAGGDGEGGDQK